MGSTGQGSQDLDSLSLKLDGRPVTLLRSLDMLRHNLVNEYPRLIRLDDPFSMMVVQSSNFNDQYRLSQFLDADMLESPAAQRRSLPSSTSTCKPCPKSKARKPSNRCRGDSANRPPTNNGVGAILSIAPPQTAA